MHSSYVESPTEAWVVADGGRCYKESEIRENFIEMVKCPGCRHKDRWFSGASAYQQHWKAVHSSR